MTPALAVALGTYATGYAALSYRLWRRRGVVHPLRALAFALGLLVVAVAVASPLDARADDGSFVAHMTQHELLLNVAPVLLLLGLDAQLAAPVSRAIGTAIARRGPGLQALLVLGSPWLALALYVGVVGVWHVPSIYAAAAASSLVHALEHASLLWLGLLFWFHLLRPLPSVRRLTPGGQATYLLLAMLGSAALAAVLAGAPVSLYPDAVSGGLTDQRLAAAVMMAVEMPLVLGVGVAVLMRAAVHPRTRTGSAWLGT